LLLFVGAVTDDDATGELKCLFIICGNKLEVEKKTTNKKNQTKLFLSVSLILAFI